MYLKLLTILILLFAVFPPYVSAQTTVSKASIKLGVGFADNVPRQIVRANNDRIFVFGAVVQTTRVIKAYWSNPGFPTSAADFPGTAQTSTTSEIISVDAVYDGGNIIHVLANDMSNTTKDYPFDITTNTFKAPITIASGTGKPGSYTDIGTTGVSGMFDKLGTLHVAYWTSTNQIMYKSYTYTANTNTLTQTSGPIQVDDPTQYSSDSNRFLANHPQLVVSPVDNSVTVAWVNGTDGGGSMRVRSKPSGGSWGTIEKVNNTKTIAIDSNVWTSPNSGINIDQGPSIIITSDNTKHIIYMEHFGSCGNDYGRIHYVKKSPTDTSWIDQSISNFCSHAPGMATNTANELFIMGHGHPSNPTCTDMADMCYIKRNTNGTWANPVVFQAHSGSDSLDASASIKWSAVGWNRPEIVEFLFFVANGGSYQNTNLWYGRIAGTLSGTTPAPATPTPTQSGPTNTPTPTPIQPSGTPINITYAVNANNRDAWSGTPGGSAKEIRISGYNASEPYDFVSNDVDNEVGGIQFAVSIPSNATITNANLILRGVQFQTPSSTGGFDINLYDVGNANAFVNTVGSDLSTHHPLYPSSIRWTDPNRWLAGIDYTSPNIASLVQYYIRRSDYTPGNYIGFAITKGTLNQNSYYGWEDFSAGNPPKLSITYTLPIVNSSPTSPLPSPTIAKMYGNANGDSKVNLQDYNILVTEFLQTGTNLAADFNNSGKVDYGDYNILVTYYAP